MKKFSQFVAENADEHEHYAEKYKAKAEAATPGSEEHRDAMREHHWHAGKAAASRGDSKKSQEHFSKWYNHSNVYPRS